MRAYIIEYRRYDKSSDEWRSKLSQEGFSTLEEAQRFVESKPGNPVRCTNMYYQTELLEEYYVHDNLVR